MLPPEIVEPVMVPPEILAPSIVPLVRSLTVPVLFVSPSDVIFQFPIVPDSAVIEPVNSPS